jgi:DNA mismatch repair protein MutL
MARTIQILTDAVANQIAAGEVVERPASVVKELVENALDAGAGRIEIRIESGGRRRLRVSDDGHGMGREDALLSLDRHATSKIREADDLRGVATFGFRGEALPSIASVSRFTLETAPRGGASGTRIRVKGGRITGVEEMARTPGTTVSVEGLFFNAPARAKFLRSPAVEARAVSDVLAPLALAHPDVTLELHSDDRVLLELPSVSDLHARIAQLWGDEVAAGMVPVDAESDGLRLRGWLQRPDLTRPGFRRAALFVAGRPFREAALLKAADRGYRTTIPREHRPWLVLFLGVPRGSVDVNVHPTKAEVRFRDRGAVENLIETTVRKALEGEASAATLDTPVGRPGAPLSGAPSPVASGPSPTSRVVRERTPARERPPAPEADEKSAQIALFVSGADDAHDADPVAGVSDAPEGAADGTSEEIPSSQGFERPRLWQVHNAWIVAEVRDGLLLIDQHAAHERVLFERIMERFDRGGVESQRLLFPLTIRLTRAEYDMVQDLKGMLHRAGFEVEGFGGDTVIVHAVPDPHPHFDAERCFREMIDELTHGSELVRSARNQHERVAMSFACKAAVKAGDPLDDRELQELFDQLFGTELPFHDVHGRPTTVRLSRAELERKFGR